jgi:hypothetical protein
VKPRTEAQKALPIGTMVTTHDGHSGAISGYGRDGWVWVKIEKFKASRAYDPADLTIKPL